MRQYYAVQWTSFFPRRKNLHCHQHSDSPLLLDLPCGCYHIYPFHHIIDSSDADSSISIVANPPLLSQCHHYHLRHPKNSGFAFIPVPYPYNISSKCYYQCIHHHATNVSYFVTETQHHRHHLNNLHVSAIITTIVILIWFLY